MGAFGKKLFNGGDPFIFFHEGLYYVYCTTENDLPAFTKEHPFYETYKNGLDGIEVHVSEDLVHWENRGLCLKKGNNVVGTHGFWAPEVSYYNGKFYMVYSADEHVVIAVAEHPDGPFEKTTDGYLMEKAAIDGHLFFDDDGSVYLYYADLHHGNHICVAKLSPDLMSVEIDDGTVLIEATEAWERMDCKIAEGPFVIKHQGVYYLTYSANHTRSEDYAVGYATSSSPFGPFVKSKHNPILHRFGDIVGTGHHSLMPTEDKNRYLCIYHCHSGNGRDFKPRKVCLAEAEFVCHNDGGLDELRICQ